MSKGQLLALSGALCLFSGIGSALAALSPTGDSAVHFEAIGPAGLKIDGTGTGLTVTDQDGKVTFTSPTTEFKTGIGLRDKHLKDHIESDRFPKATLVVDRSKISLPPEGAPSTGTVPGQFTLHGVTHPVQVVYKIKRTGAEYRVHGDTEVNIVEYNIKKPCYLGVCVEDHVKIGADFSLRGD